MKMSDKKRLRASVVLLRLSGETYSGIQKRLGCKIAKGTLSYWCNGLKLDEQALNRLRLQQLEHLKGARLLRTEKQKIIRKKYFEDLVLKNKFLEERMSDPCVVKMLLVVLYLGEGGKSITRAGPMLGNADPDIIQLYLRLLSQCYAITLSKFRCTVQCRADQDVEELEKYWSRVTNIPRSQFYKARIDARSKGKVTKKIGYRGVCRVDYFSKAVLDDILAGIVVIKNMGR